MLWSKDWGSRRAKHALMREGCDKRYVVGVVPGADGTTPASGRQSKTGEQCVSQVHGKYYEDASRGTLFGASDNAAGVACQTTLTTTGNCSLYNPANSQTRIVPVKIWVCYFSGTLGAGGFYHVIGSLASGLAAPSSGTAPAVYCTDGGYEAGKAAVGVFRYGQTQTTPSATNSLILPFASSFVELATTANPMQVIAEDFDGQFVLEPGSMYLFTSVLGAGGSSPKVSIGMTWKEVAYVATQG